jgi:formylglycine-generating enzyme required for sulfatase activity
LVGSALLLLAFPACQIVGGFKDFKEGVASSEGSGGASTGGAHSTGGADAATSSGGDVTGSGGASSSGGTSGSSGANGSGGTVAKTCPNEADPSLHGPKMAQIMRHDGTCFWMDETEVTRGDYAEFLTAPHPESEQENACLWNYAAGDGGPDTNRMLLPPPLCTSQVSGGLPLEPRDGGGADHDLPMVCVDYCDALTFCTWAGKNLCRDNGSTAPEADWPQSDWYWACVAGDKTRSYGSTSGSVATDCNGSDAHHNGPLPVGTMTNCKVPTRSGSEVISDLSGNVAEWTSWCETGEAGSNCQTRGGSYGSSALNLACSSGGQPPRNTTQATLGFRCCKDSIANPTNHPG